MKITTRLGIAALSLAVAGALFAQTPATPAPANDFASLDVNKDGRISSVEARTRADLDAVFQALDKNGDGYLTAVEFSVFSGKKEGVQPVDPSTGPGGSSGAQHMPKT